MKLTSTIEQKKRECWEEFCKEHPLDATANGGVAFRYAFDRAYALGKQTETISQEEIEDAAKDYAYDIDGSDWERQRARDGFVDGAKFSLGKQEKDAEETAIQGWVARHDNGPNDLGLCIYTVKPKRMEGLKRWNGHGEMSYLIDCRLFPDLTWDDDPIECEIIIKRKKK